MNLRHSGHSPDPLSEKVFGLLGRLHVLLRREIGRVTDIKYMSMNADYCVHVIELAREMNNADLDNVCTQLEDYFFGPKGVFGVDLPKHLQRKPSVQLSSRVPVVDVEAAQVAAEHAAHESAEVEQHYVGRLR